MNDQTGKVMRLPALKIEVRMAASLHIVVARNRPELRRDSRDRNDGRRNRNVEGQVVFVVAHDLKHVELEFDKDR